MTSLTFYEIFNSFFFFINLLIENSIFLFIWITSVYVWLVIDFTSLSVDYFNSKHNYLQITNSITFLFFLNKIINLKIIKIKYLTLVSNIL
jgi:hypothetical protein